MLITHPIPRPQIKTHRTQANFRTTSKQIKIQPTFEIFDVHKTRVQVQLTADQGELKKNSYQARVPFQVAKILGDNSYEDKRYNKPDSAVRKYKGSKLCLLPLAIFPHYPLDTTDQLYLNYDHDPIASPLKKPINIELYNDTSFSEKGQQAFTFNSHDKYSAFIDIISS